MIGAADFGMLYLPTVSPRIGALATTAAIYGAYKFTVWYPSRA
jgi:hypothetical protein